MGEDSPAVLDSLIMGLEPEFLSEDVPWRNTEVRIRI